MASANIVMLVGTVDGIDPKENALRFMLETQELQQTKVVKQKILVVYRGKRAEEVATQIIPGAKVYCGGKLSSSVVKSDSGKDNKIYYVHGTEFELL